MIRVRQLRWNTGFRNRLAGVLDVWVSGCAIALVWALSLILIGASSSANPDVPSPASDRDFTVVRGQNVPTNATAGLGAWIWCDQTYDRQRCNLWKEFEIPAGSKVTSARMRLTADNGYRFYLDGRELGQGADWRGLTDYDLTHLLNPGRHVLAVDAFNDYYQAGLIMTLNIDLASGEKLDIRSDESWRIVPNQARGWEKMDRAEPTWAHAVVIPKESVPQWGDANWPYDYVTVPPFHPIAVPLWQRPAFHIALVCACGLVFFACIALVIRLTVHSKEQRLLNLERARIARDIHDDFGTRLTRLVLEGEVARSELAENHNARERLGRISDGLREALAAMDEVLWAVNPRRDTVKDFVTYICEYAQTFLQPTNTQCFLDIEPHMPALGFDLPLRRSLLLAVKEAISNVAKHSRATRMSLRIYRDESNLVVIVEDDGIGFQTPAAGSDRHGLANMVQRMNEVGGVCEIAGNPGTGSRIEFRMPLTRSRPRFPWKFWVQPNRPRKSNRSTPSLPESSEQQFPTPKKQ